MVIGRVDRGSESCKYKEKLTHEVEEVYTADSTELQELLYL